MLLANMEAGKKLNTLGIYRIHEEPSYKEISKLVEEVNTIGIKISIQSTIKNTIKNIQNRSKNSIFKEEIDKLIIKAQTKAKYYIKDLGHFGLGFNKYAHFTSPIRRYSDLILHRILKSNKLPKDLDNICEYISKQERKINSMILDF